MRGWSKILTEFRICLIFKNMTAPEGYRAVLLKVNKFKQISHTHGPRLKNYFQIFKFH